MNIKTKKMNRFFLVLWILGIYAISYGQSLENHPYCFKRDAFKGQHLKSNSLNTNEIAETERYDVHFYSLDLSMDNLSTQVSGTAEIHAHARVNIDSALFELFNTLTISEIRVDGNQVVYSRSGSKVRVPVNAMTGQNFEISVDYSGTPPTAATNPLGGAGMSNDNSPSWGNQVTWSLSQPFSAYEWWPCKQSLSDKADSCAVKITVPTACKAGSNGVLENVVDLGNGTSRYEWKHRHPIDYYLISVSIAEYVDYSIFANPVGSPNPILIQNFIYDNPGTLPNFQADIDETIDFMELYADQFGPYPFADEKYGHCMAPFSGGMEHQTMTTQGFFNKTLTSHELAHQWWGDHVTCASWADIWVNEGFASYAEYLMIEALYPAERAQFMLDVHANVMTQAGGSVYVLDSLNESRLFSGRLSYDKGSSIVHTLRFMLNDDAMFFQGLKNYQITFADSVAKGLDVKNTMETISGLDLNAFFDEWYFGEGYPTYSARWNSVGNDLNLEITHTASMPAVTPTFTNPLELRFSRLGAPDTIVRFPIGSNLEQYLVQGMGTVTNIVLFDPNNWVINKTGTKVNDPNFFVGMEELMNPLDFSVYPNPAMEEAILRTNEKLVFDEICMLDVSGRLLATFPNTFTQLSLSGMPNGTYQIVLMKNKSIIASKRFIKM
jgi:aminopeptidase N